MTSESHAIIVNRSTYAEHNVPKLLKIIGRELGLNSPVYPQWETAADHLVAKRYNEAEEICLSLKSCKSASVWCTLFLIYLLTDRQDDAKIALIEAQDL
jgi:hypothetical protein